jgi:hypothetical protein
MATDGNSTGYDLKTASRETLEEELQIVREQLVPQMTQLQQQNEDLKQGGQSSAEIAAAVTLKAASEGYDIKSAPRELLEEDLLIVRTHMLPRMEQLQAENEALKAQQDRQGTQK